ncbi:MAG: hypothetical protein HDS62_08245 [Bacteroidales bacterium]|nr:hypothetical protein [Bacteroidales bacterium]
MRRNTPAWKRIRRRWIIYLSWLFLSGLMLWLYNRAHPSGLDGTVMKWILFAGVQFIIYVAWGPGWILARVYNIRKLRDIRILQELNEEWIRNNQDFIRKMDKVERIRQRKIKQKIWSGHDSPSATEFLDESMDEVFGDDDDYYDPYDD